MNKRDFINHVKLWSHSSWTKGDLLDYWKKGGLEINSIFSNKGVLKNQSVPVAILGSVGKTTLSKLLVALFRSNGERCFEPKINDNWLPQLPFAVELARRSFEQYSVFECGIARKGDAFLMGQIVPSDLVIFTPFEKVHINYLGGLEEIAREKLSFIDSSNPKSILVHESNKVLTRELGGLEFYGGENSRYSGKVIHFSEFGMEIEIKGEIRKSFFIPDGGYHLIDALVGALEVYSTLTSKRLDEISFDPMKYNSPAQRMQRIQSGGNTYILDTANANQSSILNSLKSFSDLNSKKRKIVVLGEVYGMGDEMPIVMEEIISRILSLQLNGLDEIHFIGDYYYLFRDKLKSLCPITSFNKTQDEFEQYHNSNLYKNDLILLRGPSRMGRNLSSLIEGYDAKSDETCPDDLVSSGRNN